MRLRLLAPGLAALTAVAAGQASAAPQWHETVPILAGEVAGAPAAATAVSGEALVVVPRAVAGGRFAVQALSRGAPRGAFSPPVTISATAPRAFREVAAAVGPRGQAVAAWVAPGGAVQAARRETTAGPWRRLRLGYAPESTDLRVVLTGGGGAAVMWTRPDPAGGWLVEGEVAPSLTAPFAPMPRLAADAAEAPRIALDPALAAAAAWVASGDARIRAARLAPAAAGWEAAADLSGAGASDPDVAVDTAGGAAAAWTLGDRVEGGIRRPKATDWTTVAVSHSGRFPHVSRDPGGGVVFQWADLVANDLKVQTSVIRAGATEPGPVITVYDDFEFPSAILTLEEARLVAAGAGNAVLTWRDPEGPGSESLFAAVLRGPVFGGDSSSWTAPRPLIQYESTGLPAVATTPQGNALVAAAREGENPDLRVAIQDSFPPVQVRATVRAPASVRRGGRVTWTFRVANPGLVPAADVVVTHYLPTGMAFVRATPAPQRRPDGQRRWRLGLIPAGGVRTITLVTTTGTRLAPRLASIVVTAREVAGFVVSGQTRITRGPAR